MSSFSGTPLIVLRFAMKLFVDPMQCATVKENVCAMMVGILLNALSSATGILSISNS